MVTMCALFCACIILFISSFLTVCAYVHYVHLCYTPNRIGKYYKSKYSSYFNRMDGWINGSIAIEFSTGIMETGYVEAL